jgi:hypothetical protein
MCVIKFSRASFLSLDFLQKNNCLNFKITLTYSKAVGLSFRISRFTMSRISSFRVKAFIATFNLVAILFVMLHWSMNSSTPSRQVKLTSDQPLSLLDITPFLIGNTDDFFKNFDSGKVQINL